MGKAPDTCDLLWTLVATVLGLATGIVALIVWEAFR